MNTDTKQEINAAYGKKVENGALYGLLMPKRSFWDRLTETRFSWLDVMLATLLLSLPGIILALIPW